MKVTERAPSPGNCWLCGGTIFVGDVITRFEAEGNPVAAHAQCDPDVSATAASVPK